MKEETKERFNQGSKDYITDRYYWRQKSAELVVKLANPQKDDVILDVGCGTGEQITALADKIKLGIGIDMSEGMVEEARKRAAEKGCSNVEFHLGTFAEPDQKIDLEKEEVTKIISNYALHHLNLSDKQQAIEQMIKASGRSLKKIFIGDLIFFEDPADYKDQYSVVGYGPEVDQPSTVEELKECFSEFDFNVEVHKLHSLVGVLVAMRD